MSTAQKAYECMLAAEAEKRRRRGLAALKASSLDDDPHGDAAGDLAIVTRPVLPAPETTAPTTSSGTAAPGQRGHDRDSNAGRWYVGLSGSGYRTSVASIHKEEEGQEEHQEQEEAEEDEDSYWETQWPAENETPLSLPSAALASHKVMGSGGSTNVDDGGSDGGTVIGTPVKRLAAHRPHSTPLAQRYREMDAPKSLVTLAHVRDAGWVLGDPLGLEDTLVIDEFIHQAGASFSPHADARAGRSPGVRRHRSNSVYSASPTASELEAQPSCLAPRAEQVVPRPPRPKRAVSWEDLVGKERGRAPEPETPW